MKSKRLLASILAILLLLMTVGSAIGSPVYAEEQSNKTVKMGFFEFGGMFEGARDGMKKSGYCYEYMMQLAIYTGWKYEFVYGSYAELYEKLKNGEIDILPYTNYNDQRGQEVLFSDEDLCEEEYFLATRSKDEDVLEGGIEALNGATVSTIVGADYNSLLTDYIEQNNLDVKIEYYRTVEESWDALRYNRVRASVITSAAYNEEDWRILCSFGKKPTYIAVTKDKPELLRELNDAMNLSDKESPAFRGDLLEKYFSDDPMRKGLTVEEQKWIDEHPVLHVGGFSNDPSDMNVSDKDNPTGLTVDLVNGIDEKLNLGMETEYLTYDTLDEMEAALDSGEIDIIYPFYPDYYIAQQKNLYISNVVRTANMELVYKEDTLYTSALSKIATPATRLGIYYVQDHYPKSKILKADSVKDSVDKVRKGEAFGAIAYSDAIDPIKERYNNLNSVILLEGCGTCFAARPEDHAIIMVLNRGLNYFHSSEISALSAKYTTGTNVTTRAYLAAHSEVVALLTIALLFFIALIWAVFRMRKLVDEERKLHTELESAKKAADEANASKTTFLFNMSHDIRTPMNAVMGFTNMAKKHIDDKERTLDSLSKAEEAGEMLLSLINKILDMSRIESGEGKLEEKPIDLRTSFDRIDEILLTLSQYKNIELKFEYGRMDDPFIYGDPEKINRIIMNLVSNAIKYTEEGGHVWAKCEQVGEVEDGMATFRYTFRDDGIGMSDEFLQHAFEQFSRERNTTISGVQGTGIGLALVKSFVEMMGGTIKCESEQGKGTIFTVILKLKVQEDTKETFRELEKRERETAAMERFNFDGKRVLVVEDNELNMEIAEDILSEEGLIIEKAFDGIEAVEILKEKGPDYYDFVLMDIQMPRMNGYEATKAIRAMYPDDHVPIIALSANVFAEDKEASMSVGMDDHVAKPINVHELFEALQRLI